MLHLHFSDLSFILQIQFNHNFIKNITALVIHTTCNNLSDTWLSKVMA